MDPSQPEKIRLDSSPDEKKWRKWGPYVSERQWATVREDYSPHGDPWGFVSHQDSRSKAYRWGEDAIAGFCDTRQFLCLAPAFWNGNDPIIKERLFGLTNIQGNHGEDVKELYFHLDSSPTHSYCKYLYKYPQTAFPYESLIQGAGSGKDNPEYEILETGIFSQNRYFDCFIEYAQAEIDDILLKITVYNRGAEKHSIHVLPHLWFRNYWSYNPRYGRPFIFTKEEGLLISRSIRNGKYHLYHEGGDPLFCENETNNKKLNNTPNATEYVKDGINDYVTRGAPTVNPKNKGSKAAIWFQDEIGPGKNRIYRLRLSKKANPDPWKGYDEIFVERKRETDEFYARIIPSTCNDEKKHLIRSAFGGLMWTKQFYYFDVYQWLFGEPDREKPQRTFQRNVSWQHLTNRNIISMPDKWEYPWYAAWDLAFHTASLVEVDPRSAKHQLHLLLTEYYLHPNGQIPAYEWNFSDVNPPVHSLAVWHVFQRDRKNSGKGDYQFLEKCFQKLLINFTWWVNRKDKDDQSLFEGGFLGLDNIGVFDRNHMPSGIKSMQQADATSWMAMFALNMLRMSLVLAKRNKAYEESASKFFRHFLNIGWAMHNIGGKAVSLWDDEDAFYYDVIQLESGFTDRLKVRSLVGIIPLFAVEVLHKDLFTGLGEFRRRTQRIIRTRPDLASLISRIEEVNADGYYLFSIMRGHRLEMVLKRLLDENEFLSPFGIRSLSKYHEEHPFVFTHHGEHSIEYTPGESKSDMFGGNSNWRGPIWIPLNYLIIQSLRKFYKYFGPDYVYEFPTGSGKKLNLKEIALGLTHRLLRLFERDKEGKYHYHDSAQSNLFGYDKHFRNYHLFYEYFHGDTGKGLGASHQTGWTALIANLVLEMEE